MIVLKEHIKLYQMIYQMNFIFAKIAIKIVKVALKLEILLI